MNYEVTYNSNLTDAAASAIFIPILIISLASMVFGIIVMWKLFVKAGKPGWASIVPFYNLYVFFEITWGNGWLFLLILLSIIPIVGSIAVLVIMIITMVKLAKAFGKSGGFAVGLVFLTLIFEAILAFGDSKYVGVNGVAAQEPTPQPNTDAPVQPVVQPTVEQPVAEQPVAEQPVEQTFDQPAESNSVEPTQSDENNNF